MLNKFLHSKLPRHTLRESGAGFTMIEIILSIAIISLLAAFVWVAIDPAKKIGDAKDANRYLGADAIKEAIEEYVLENRAWPTELAGLVNNKAYLLVSSTAAYNNPVDCSEVVGGINTTTISSIIPTYLATLPAGPDNFINRFYHVNRNPNRPGLVGDSSGNRLSYPPSSVGGKFIAFFPIVFLYRSDQAFISFLNQIQK